MNYLAYHFTVTPPQPGTEILCAMLGEYPFESFDLNESGFVAYIKEEDADGVTLDDMVFEDFTYTCNIETIAPSNWNLEWEKNFDPVQVDDRLLIRAPFHQSAQQHLHEIVIMPKMSFGTGHHQTTRMVCRQMFEINIENKRVLDMGCGTGVLAILAAKLGASAIKAIDIDDWSVENAHENCTSNGHSEIEVIKGGAEALENTGMFDIILANINKNILKAQLPIYANHAAVGTTLILSGFFTTDAAEMTELAASSGFQHVKTVSENEWAAMVFAKV